MHKILLILFVFISLILTLPVSESFAAPTVPQCTNHSIDDKNPVQRDDIGNCPAGNLCYLPVTVKTVAGDKRTSYCYKSGVTPASTIIAQIQAGTAAPGGAAPLAPGGATAPLTGAPCTGPNCTSGAGLQCDPNNSGNPGTGGIMTAIGCVPNKPQELIEAVLRYGTIAAGAVAFLLMILGALQMVTAEGNPEAIKHAQERFYSAIIGLLVIIFSVLLMQVIGVDLLDLPGFNR